MKSRENLRTRKSTGDPPYLKSLEQMCWGGARVTIATGWNMKSGGREEYLVYFLFEAVSAALPAEWDVECRYESARVLTTVSDTGAGSASSYAKLIARFDDQPVSAMLLAMLTTVTFQFPRQGFVALPW